jgi:hypothetical protein
MIAPTFADLIMTFQDSDGDFSAYQIRKLILADGESRGIFKKTSEGLLGKLLPKIEPAAEASDDIKEGQKIIEEAARRLHESGRLGNDISLALSKTVFKKTEKSPGSLDEQNAALRIRLLYYVIGFSLALAFALSCLAAC